MRNAVRKTYVMRIERCECGLDPVCYFKDSIGRDEAAGTETFVGLCREEAAAQRKAYRDDGTNPAHHIAKVPFSYPPRRVVVIVPRPT